MSVVSSLSMQFLSMLIAVLSCAYCCACGGFRALLPQYISIGASAAFRTCSYYNNDCEF